METKPVLLLCADFLFSSRILETARQLGVEVVTVRSGAPAEGGSPASDLILVDLGLQGATEAIARLRAERKDTRIVAFVRHDDVDSIRAAREAGASDVLARSAFVQRLPSILRSPQTGAFGGPAEDVP